MALAPSRKIPSNWELGGERWPTDAQSHLTPTLQGYWHRQQDCPMENQDALQKWQPLLEWLFSMPKGQRSPPHSLADSCNLSNWQCDKWPTHKRKMYHVVLSVGPGLPEIQQWSFCGWYYTWWSVPYMVVPAKSQLWVKECLLQRWLLVQGSPVNE